MSLMNGPAIIVVLLLAQLLTVSTLAAGANIPRTEDWYPVWTTSGDVTAHDPTIAEEDGVWWVFHTGAGLQVKSSPDGHTWTQVSPVFAEPLPWWKDFAPRMGYNDVWAPDIEKYDGKWWLYYAVSEFGKNNSAIGLASTDSIASGSWKDEGLVISSNLITSYNAIDPNLVVDENGDPWLVFGSWFSGIQIVRLDKRTMKPVDQDSITTIARRKVNGQAAGIEGPTITYRDGYYYLFVSVDHCCNTTKSDYKIAVGRSPSIIGPYLDKNGVDMLNGGGTILDAGSTRYNGVGGQDVYGNRLLVRHGYDRVIRGLHVLLISDLAWDADGWPTVCDNPMNGYYKIQNKQSGKYLIVAYDNTENGARARQGDDRQNSSEWQVYRKEEGYYRIQNKNSLKYLEVTGASTEPGAGIQQGSYENNDHRLWMLVKQDNGYYRIVNKNSGLVLEVPDTTTGNGSDVVQGIDTGTDNQLWKLIPVND